MTFDRPADGLVVAQPARGFRYTSDAFWLAGFALDTGPAPHTALDLGTGSGVVAMLLAGQGIDVTGVDAFPGWEICWRETLARSAPRGRVVLRVSDVTDVSVRADVVVANPPYAAAGSGPVSPDVWKAAARTEHGGGLAGFVRAAVRAATDRACFVVPREREQELLDLAGRAGWGAARTLRVGDRRTLVCLREGALQAEAETATERSDVVQALVARATRAGS
jgi:tRNA1(Val) A37 N6-methylase TrmN6